MVTSWRWLVAGARLRAAPVGAVLTADKPVINLPRVASGAVLVVGGSCPMERCSNGGLAGLTRERARVRRSWPGWGVRR